MSYKKRQGLSLFVYIYTLGGAIILGIMILLNHHVYSGQLPRVPGLLAISFVLFGWGWLGVLFAYRKEFPQLYIIRGRLAVIYGIGITFVFWTMSLWALILLVMEF